MSYINIYQGMRLCNTPGPENLEIIIYNIKENKLLHIKDENWPNSDQAGWLDVDKFLVIEAKKEEAFFPTFFNSLI